MKPLCLVGLVLLLIPSSSRADTFTDVALVGYVVASVADAGVTHQCLERGICRETNPLLLGAMVESGSTAALVGSVGVNVGLAYLMRLYQQKYPVAGRWLAGGALGWKMGVVVNNVRLR